MCTRVFNNYDLQFLSTARNMDWATQLPTTLFSFKYSTEDSRKKIGVDKSDNINANRALRWTAKYDSVVTMVGPESNYAASDGINSEGLVANVLYDCNANYGKPSPKPNSNLNILRWVQFVLDTCASVQDVVNTFDPEVTKNPITLIGAEVPGTGKPASLHLSVSDLQGRSAIIEIDNGEYQIYSDVDKPISYRVMTNEPNYATQIVLNQYWRWQWSKENIFPSNTLPGGPFPSDRFARASFYLNHLYAPKSIDDSLAQSKSIVMNASVPVNFNSEALLISQDHPNIAQTLWTTIASHNSLTYYFCNARLAEGAWIDMKNTEFPLPNTTSRFTVVNEQRIDGKEVFINIPKSGLINSALEPCTDPYTIDQTITVTA